MRRNLLNTCKLLLAKNQVWNSFRCSHIKKCRSITGITKAFYSLSITSTGVKTNSKFYDQITPSEPNEIYHNPEVSTSKKVLRDITVEKPISVQNLAALLDVPIDELQQSLLSLALPKNPKDTLSIDEAELVAYEFDCKVISEQRDYNQMPIR